MESRVTSGPQQTFPVKNIPRTSYCGGAHGQGALFPWPQSLRKENSTQLSGMEMPAPMLRPRPDGVWGQEAGSRPGPVTDLLRVLRVTPSPVGLSFPIGRSRKALRSISQLRPSAIFVTCSLKATLWTHNPHFTDKEDEALKGMCQGHTESHGWGTSAPRPQVSFGS